MDQKKIVITGSNGLLGQKLIQLFVRENFEVIAISKGENRNKHTQNYTYYKADLINFDFVTNLLKKIKPHFIINAAALTNVDTCQLQKRKCAEINFRAVLNLISSCEKNAIHLIQISTDFVFDGEQKQYSESDKPNPINQYGLSKWKAEKAITRSKIDATIFRTSLIYDLNDYNNQSNILLWVKKELESKKELNLVTDQFRMPTLSDDLAFACLLAVQKEITGIYHISSNELLSIYEIGLQIATTFHLDKSLLKPIPTSQLNQRAKRPKYTGLKIEKAVNDFGFLNDSFSNRLAFLKDNFDAKIEH